VGVLLNHDPRPTLRNHVRDNVHAMREKAKQQRLQREEEASREKPAFKLRQFENVPSRLHREPRRSPSAPSRPSSAPAHRDDTTNCSPGRSCEGHSRSAYVASSPSLAESPGWRVASGYRSLTSPDRPGLEPFAPVPSTPPRPSPKMQPRCLSTPVKSPDGSRRRASSPARKLVPGSAGTEDDGRFDVGSFERVAKQQKQRQGKTIPAKDAQGRPTCLQHSRGSPQGPLSHSGEHIPDAIPAGYRLMPESERLDNLEELQLKLAELDDRYCRLPLRIETEGQRQQQRMLREKIAETNKALSVFARPRVLVEV